MPSGLFAGLVQGLGQTVQQQYNYKRQQDDAKKQDMFHLLSSALMNDDNLPGSARKEGLRQIGKQYGVKLDDAVLNQIVPDTQIETPNYMADSVPESNAHKAIIEDMPVRPSGVDTGPAERVQMGGAAPKPAGQQAQKQTVGGQEDEQYGANLAQGMFPMPRNPMTDPPVVLGSAAPLDLAQTTAPVTQQYTSGTGANYDDLDLQMKIKQLEAQLETPPQRRHTTVSSLGLSRAQIAEMRTKRLQQDQLERDVTMGQYQDAMKMQQAHREQIYQMGMATPLLQAKMQAIQQVYGQQLSPQQRAQVLDIQPTGLEAARQAEAQDYVLMTTQPGTPEGMAAKERVRRKELDNVYQLSQIQENIAQIHAAAQKLSDPTNNPQLVNAAKVNAAKSASSQWNLSDRQEYIEKRVQYWEQELQNPASIEGVDPVFAQFQALAKDNPQQRRQRAVMLAQKDAQTYQQRLSDMIFQFSFPSGDQVVTSYTVRHLAEKVASEGKNPDAVWTYMKEHAIILDDDLNVFSTPPQQTEQSPAPVSVEPRRPPTAEPKRGVGLFHGEKVGSLPGPPKRPKGF